MSGTVALATSCFSSHSAEAPIDVLRMMLVVSAVWGPVRGEGGASVAAHRRTNPGHLA